VGSVETDSGFDRTRVQSVLTDFRPLARTSVQGRIATKTRALKHCLECETLDAEGKKIRHHYERAVKTVIAKKLETTAVGD